MKSNSIFAGLLLIMAGVIVLLINLGYGSWDILWQIWRLWPLVLVIIGIKILWRGPSSEWFSYGVLFLSGAAIIALLLINPKTGPGPGNTGFKNYQTITVTRSEYPGIIDGKAEIDFGGGRLTLNSNTSEWVEGYFGGFEARTAVENLNNTLMVNLKQSGHFPGRWWRHHDRGNPGNWGDDGGSNPNFNWEIRFSPDLNWDIVLRTGAAKAEADLSNLHVKELDLKMGVGDFSLVLGDKTNNSLVKINAGASKIKVKIPKGLGVKVNTTGALVHTNLGGLGWIYSDRAYNSPGYDQAIKHLTIDLNMAVGDFEMEVAR
jgi:hypothetical protein